MIKWVAYRPPLRAIGGNCVFWGGTNSAATKLEYVTVKYGNGVKVERSSPSLNNLTLENNQGAAITTDLFSSPTGSGLVATGNGTNGIVVSAGMVTDAVRWGLLGIPYVLAQGVIEVGGSTERITLPTNTMLVPGNAVDIPIVLSVPAPESGVAVALKSSNASVVTVPALVQIAAGATQGTVRLSALSDGYVQITASALGYQDGQAAVRVDASAFSLAISPGGPISISAGTTAVRQVTLSASAPANVPVQISVADSSIASISANTVQIPQGSATSASFAIQGIKAGKTTLTLSSPGLGEKVVALEIVEPAVLQFVVGDAQGTRAIIGAGLQSQDYLKVQRTVNGQPYAGSEPLTVTIANAAPDKLTVPQSVTISAGVSNVILPVAGIAAVDNVQVQASANNVLPVSLGINVVTPVLQFSGLDGTRMLTSPRDQFTVSLAVPGSNGVFYPSADMAVNLSVTNANPADVVAGLFASASGGQLVNQVTLSTRQNASQNLYVGEPKTAGNYQISANSVALNSGISPVQTVSQKALRLVGARGVTDKPTVIGKSFRARTEWCSTIDLRGACVLYVERTNAGLPDTSSSPLSVTLLSQDIQKVSVPISVTIPAGESWVPVPVSGLAVSAETQVTASDANDEYARAELGVQVVDAMVYFDSGDKATELDDRRMVGGGEDHFQICAKPAVDGYPGYQTLASDLGVALEVIDQVPSDVVPGLHPDGESVFNPVWQAKIAGNYTCGGFAVGSASGEGSYRVRATLPGQVPLVSNTQKVVKVIAHLDVANASGKAVVGKNLQTVTPLSLGNGEGLTMEDPALKGELSVSLWDSDGLPFVTESSIPLALSLTTLDDNDLPTYGSYIDLPYTEVSSGQHRVNLPLRGRTVGTYKVKISQDSPLASGSQALVEVVNPEIHFMELDGLRQVGGGRDAFSLSYYVPGAAFPYQLYADYYPVQFSVTSNIVSGTGVLPEEAIWDAPEGGNGSSVGNVTFPMGANTSLPVYIASPAQPGAYEIVLRSVEEVEVRSSTVTVVENMNAYPALRFVPGSSAHQDVLQNGAVWVGYGLVEPEALLIERSDGGALTQDLVVSLHCADPTVCQVPETILLPAGASFVSVPVTGLRLGSTSIVATASGYQSAAPFAVKTVESEIRVDFSPPVIRVGGRAQLGFSLMNLVEETPSSKGYSGGGQLLAFNMECIPSVYGAPGTLSQSVFDMRAGVASSVTGVEFAPNQPGFYSGSCLRFYGKQEQLSSSSLIIEVTP